MENCLVPYVIAIILFIISLVFIIMTINLHNESQKNNLLGLYDIKENETLTKVINIRKNDGTSCNISTIYEDGKENSTSSGGACK
tara:strand:+ start:4235 stop:4489 length:255 start_codon:yes stop_codon:yes gene_type:complete